MPSSDKIRNVPFVLFGAGGRRRCSARSSPAARTAAVRAAVTAVGACDSSGVLRPSSSGERPDAALERLIEYKAGGGKLAELSSPPDEVAARPSGRARPTSSRRWRRAPRHHAASSSTARRPTRRSALLQCAEPGSTLRRLGEQAVRVVARRLQPPRRRPARRARYFESTVCAGVPVVAAMQRTVAAADAVSRVAGCSRHAGLRDVGTARAASSRTWCRRRRTRAHRARPARRPRRRRRRAQARAAQLGALRRAIRRAIRRNSTRNSTRISPTPDARPRPGAHPRADPRAAARDGERQGRPCTRRRWPAPRARVYGAAADARRRVHGEGGGGRGGGEVLRYAASVDVASQSLTVGLLAVPKDSALGSLRAPTTWSRSHDVVRRLAARPPLRRRRHGDDGGGRALRHDRPRVHARLSGRRKRRNVGCPTLKPIDTTICTP